MWTHKERKYEQAGPVDHDARAPNRAQNHSEGVRHGLDKEPDGSAGSTRVTRWLLRQVVFINCLSASLLQAVSDSSPLVSQRIHQPSRKSDTTQLKSTSTINRHHEGLEDKTVSFERDDKMTMRAAFRSLNIGGLPPQSYLTVKVSGVEWVNAPAVTVTVTL